MVQGHVLMVVAYLASGDVDSGLHTARSSCWICFVVATRRLFCYYRCPAMVETEAQEGQPVMTVAPEAVGPSVPAKP